MLFSVCAIAASAVNGDGTESIRIYITSDAKVGTPAGKPVNVSYYIDLPDGVDELQMGIGNISLGYNSSKYAVNTDGSSGDGFAEDALTWGDNFGQYMKSTCRVTIKDSISNSIVGNFNANDEAKGWDKALQVQMLYDGTNSAQSKGFPVGDNEHIFTLEFITLDTLTAEDVIGVVEGAYGKSTFKICYFNGSNR